jgi:hypothetical protein
MPLGQGVLSLMRIRNILLDPKILSPMSGILVKIMAEVLGYLPWRPSKSSEVASVSG